MPRTLTATVLLCLASTGCAPAGACVSAPATTLAVGGGLDDFIPFDGAPILDLVYGPQGGVHVEVSLLATGLDVNAPWRTELTASQEGTIVGSSAESEPQPRCREDGTGATVSGLLLIFEDWVRAGDFDEPIEIVAEVRDQEEGLAEAVEQSVSVRVP